MRPGSGPSGVSGRSACCSTDRSGCWRRGANCGPTSDQSASTGWPRSRPPTSGSRRSPAERSPISSTAGSSSRSTGGSGAVVDRRGGHELVGATGCLGRLRRCLAPARLALRLRGWFRLDRRLGLGRGGRLRSPRLRCGRARRSGGRQTKRAPDTVLFGRGRNVGLRWLRGRLGDSLNDSRSPGRLNRRLGLEPGALCPGDLRAWRRGWSLEVTRFDLRRGRLG